jgi:hypothetical protein
MADNYIHYRHVGITGGTIDFTLKDASGPVNLTGWTGVTIVAIHPGSDSIKFTHPATSVLDQTVTANHGKGTYQPVAGDVDTIGEFTLYFLATDPNGRPWEFPTDDPEGDLSYGKLVIY